MREIKFRGFSKENNQWVYGLLEKHQNRIWENGQNWQDGFRFSIASHKTPIGVWDVEEKTIGLFTGYKDKTGKEIYEGDIIEYITKGRFTIVWDYDLVGFGAKSEGSNAIDPIVSAYFRDCKVIDNIHNLKNKLHINT